MRVPPVKSILSFGPGTNRRTILASTAIAESDRKYFAGFRNVTVRGGNYRGWRVTGLKRGRQ